MVNKTIVEGLRPYALGEKLRDLKAAQEHGSGGIGQAYRSFGGNALQAGTGQAVSHAAHVASDRAWCSALGWNISSPTSASVMW